MSSVIEDTVKALVEFESELDKAKAAIADAKRGAMRDASDWAESAKSAAISRAQEMASQRVAMAKEEAESAAGKIRKKGEADLSEFERSISRMRSKASELVRARLLGESS